MSVPSVDSLWAREGDHARTCWEAGAWSVFSSKMSAGRRSFGRSSFHGFDFRVESDAGTKRVVRGEGATESPGNSSRPVVITSMGTVAP